MLEKISSMGIVISNLENVLLLLNSEGEWVFPKGHVEVSENYIQAAIREVQEESGIKLSEDECLGQVDEFTFYFEGEKAIKRIKVFLFKVNDEKDIIFKKEEGFIDGKWVSYKEALKILKHDDARESLRKANNKLQSLIK